MSAEELRAREEWVDAYAARYAPMVVWVLVALAAMGAAGIWFAARASAGCESQAFAQYCDGPVRPDGTWDRCMVAYGTTNVFGATVIPDVSRCYPIDPTAFPLTPLGQPPQHIYP